MSRRTIVDPRFPELLRRLRIERGLSLRELARGVPCSHVHLWDIEQGRKVPSPSVATRLDEELSAGGELACLVYVVDANAGPDDEDRLLYVARNPRVLDPATVDLLADLLAGQRRLEDQIGSAPLVTSVLAQVGTVAGLVKDAPDGDLRVRLVDVAAQWAQFVAWLCVTTGDKAAGGGWYMRAMEWAAEAGNPHMVATVLSMRGHLAWINGQTRTMIELSRAAAWQPASNGVKALATQQEARGLALIGDAEGADAKLDQAEQFSVKAAEHPDLEPPWLYFYDPDFLLVQRGLALRYLKRHERAAELLTDGLDRLPAEIRRCDWIGWYVCQLAATHAAAGDVDVAATVLEEARRIAEATAAARLAGDVERLSRTLNL